MAQVKFTDNALLLAIMYVLIGIVMAACGNGSINFIFWLTGVIYILIGIVQIVTKAVDIKGGLITIIIGIIIIILGMFLGRIIVGIILILSSLPALIGVSSGIADKFGMAKIDTGNAMINKIITIVLLVVGVCLIAGLCIGSLDGIADILIRIGGVILLLVGLLDLVKALKS